LPNSTKMEVIPAMLVIYEGGKTINLCSRDKYFDTFVKKVTQIYNDEKNNILEDSLTDPFRMRRKIEINEHTKNILESGTLTNINDFYKFYDNKESFETSLLFQCDEVQLLMPIIKHHIKELLSHTDKNVIFEDEVTGYMNNYILSGQINGLYKYFPLIFDKISDNEYIIQIGGLLENNVPIKMNIKFLKDSITININIDKYNIESNFTYLISLDTIKEIQIIKRNNITVHYLNKDLKETENIHKQITDFDQNSNLKWFMLPWNATYGISTNIQNISETEKIIEIYNMYLDINLENSFIKKEYFSKNYKRNDTTSIKGTNVKLDEAIKNTIGLCLNKKNGIYIIETAFLNTTKPSGYYLENLKGKYFYHLMQSNNIENIDKEKLVNIGFSDGIIEDADILNDSLTLKLVKGK